MKREEIEALLSEVVELHAKAKVDAVLARVLTAFQCETGTLHCLNEQTGLLELVAQQGIPEVLMDKISQIPLGKGIAGAAAEQRSAVQMCNLQTDDSGVARPDAKKTQVAGSLAVPLLHQGKLCGTLGIGKRVPYDFNDEEVGLLNQVATALAGTGEL